MATGYTAAVGEGIVTTLREFALQCARAMGACIMMRDDPWDAKIPERFEPSTAFHDLRLLEARNMLQALTVITPGQCEQHAQEDYQKRRASHEEYLAKKAAENQNYINMKQAVEAWETKADGIRDFMLQQLSISIDDWSPESPKQLNGAEWLERELESASCSVAYYEKARAEEIQRTEARNQWLADLRASLPAA